ncbi:LysR family transcriptional regulator [Brevibacillus brevis]|uniref:LysR family transcriptional regulator n=1 Tax=Brevibacillus brevis TaxID=1393 RepID=UPI0011598E87|nr:LysR family transcriptional regulator [Lysinibacillus sp. SDF0063]TQR33371.1 LysR family transcriptional regulator [Lysinibacillus sp. SDF0063]
MTLTQLQVFVAAAKAGSFTRAAEEIGFTQSAVSQMIQSLEKELGVSLFQRSRSGITPTSIGERMLSHARDILNITSCMTEEANVARGISSGTLRIASIPSVASRFLPGLLGSFRKRFPAVDILLLEGDSDEISNWLHNSVVDIAFTVMPDKEMQTLPLLQDEMMVILPDTHPLKDSQTLRFSEIAERCFIMPKDGCIRKMLQENHITPTVTFEVREVYTILTMVQEYIGVTIMPELYMPPVIPKVVAIPLSPPITREVVLAVRNWQSISPLTAEFAVHSQQYVKGMDFTPASK